MNTSPRLPKTDLVLPGSWKHLLYLVLKGEYMLIFHKRQDNNKAALSGAYWNSITYYLPSRQLKFHFSSDVRRIDTLNELSRRFRRITVLTEDKRNDKEESL